MGLRCSNRMAWTPTAPPFSYLSSWIMLPPDWKVCNGCVCSNPPRSPSKTKKHD